ncbi:MAG: hypothetical protein BWX45_00405 [Deltaproteobacteria bacterium ADurb.Bin002]|nr:MAG: hypothetical protein BWX45_00405 [Deltaproteobacteria bacterium ADurb.Bin002]
MRALPHFGGKKRRLVPAAVSQQHEDHGRAQRLPSRNDSAGGNRRSRSVSQNSRGRHDQQSEEDSRGKQHLRHLALPDARDIDSREKNNEQRGVQRGGQRTQTENFRGIVAGEKRHHRDSAGLDDGQARPGVEKSGRKTERSGEIVVISPGVRTGGHQLRVAQGADHRSQPARKPQEHQHPFAFGAGGHNGRGLENAHAQHHAHDNGRRIHHGKRLLGSGEFKHRDIPFSGKVRPRSIDHLNPKSGPVRPFSEHAF